MAKIKDTITKIIMYETSWCGDCLRAKNFFNKFSISVEHINIDDTPSATEKVIEINKGNRSVPTIVIEFEDGTNTVLVEPNWDELSVMILEPEKEL